MKRHVASLAFGSLLLFSIAACEARVEANGPREECRTVAVHNRREVEDCHTRCHDETCHTECKEHERVSREKHCWID